MLLKITVHIVEKPPLYYKLCLEYLQNIKVKDPNFVFKPGLSCKLIYAQLININKYKPRCVITFPTINFKTVFANLCNKVIDPVVLNVSFKLAHDIIPVAYKLNSWNFFQVQPHCKNCLPKRINETITHCFWECKTILPAKCYVQKTLTSKCNIDLTSEIVRFTTIPNHTVNKDLAVLILTEYRYSVWNCRCKVQIENKNPLAKSVLELLLARLNNRLVLDFNRFNIIQFTNF